VPKKRGPKTDVLEALLKRVDGLEKRLHTEGKSDDLDLDSSAILDANDSNDSSASPSYSQHPGDIATNRHNSTNHASQLMSPVEPRCAAVDLCISSLE